MSTCYNLRFWLCMCDISDLKIATFLDGHQKQRTVTEFLFAEGGTPFIIHKWLHNVFKRDYLDYCNVHGPVIWINLLNPVRAPKQLWTC